MSEEEIFETIVKHIAEVMGLDPQYISWSKPFKVNS